MKIKPFSFECCCCGKTQNIGARGLIQARFRLHRRFDWASTSMDSPTAKDICQECSRTHVEYEKGRPFKQSMFAHLGKVK